MGNRAMSRSSMRAKTKTYGAFLGRLHREVTATIDLEAAPTSFVERVLSLDQVWPMFDQPASAGLSTTLLVGSRHVDDVALERNPGPLEQERGHSLHPDHLLHIQCPSTIKKTISNITREGIVRPALRFNGDNIGMGHQQEWWS